MMQIINFVRFFANLIFKLLTILEDFFIFSKLKLGFNPDFKLLL